MASKIEGNYILGQSEFEYERLTFQARIIRPFTERFFRFAGVSPGMHVLEIGSGMGDVAFLAGEIVGAGGGYWELTRMPLDLRRRANAIVSKGILRGFPSRPAALLSSIGLISSTQSSAVISYFINRILEPLSVVC